MKINTTKKSPNYSDRHGTNIDLLVLHHTAGLMPGCLETLCNPLAKVSAHYLITRTGEIFRLVEEQFTAWHVGLGDYDVNGNGIVSDDEKSLNVRSIGIELESLGKAYTQQQLAQLDRLVIDIMTRHNIHINNLVGHKELTARKIDPGNFDMEAYRLSAHNQMYMRGMSINGPTRIRVFDRQPIEKQPIKALPENMVKGVPWYRKTGLKRALSATQGIGLLVAAMPGKSCQLVGAGIVAITTAILGTAGVQDGKLKKVETGQQANSTWAKILTWVVEFLKKIFGGK